MLEIADANVTSSGKKMTGLGKWSVKSRHKTFMNTMMAGRMNIIICLRGKDKYVQQGSGENAKITMEGFVPLQERNFKYDMMVQLPMPEGGRGRYSMDETKGFKCPEDLLSYFQEGKQLDEEVGRAIVAWVSTGAPVDELLRQLKATAIKEAEQGVDHFREYWKLLPRERQIQLKPFLGNFESIAKDADLEKVDETAEGVPPTLNANGSDIRSLIEPMTSQRRPEDADWWLLVEEYEPTVRRCQNMKDLMDWSADNNRITCAFAVAPVIIQTYWGNVLLEVQKNFVSRKVA